jgi:hypothetical protein
MLLHELSIKIARARLRAILLFKNKAVAGTLLGYSKHPLPTIDPVR